ncbi:DUF3833 domain-containing protein [Colwellia sp. KU-HH00111]|uniref:DUF3833 domain-containing protein n=1 Tax=Colwellia sp. KU-HH00111 TaxID=3127652 RepID=UPI00310C7F2D
MINYAKYTLACFASYFLVGCSTNIEDYQTANASFDIKRYFSGNVIAWGIIEDYSNKVNRRFCVEINGTWQGDTGVLAEKFYYDDSEISYRNWQLTKHTDGSYTGKAEDVIGTAKGVHQGFAFQFNYTLALEIEDNTYQVNMDDWMYQLDEYRVMNKTTLSKFGIDLAQVTIFFDKQTPFQSCQAITPLQTKVNI